MHATTICLSPVLSRHTTPPTAWNKKLTFFVRSRYGACPPNVYVITFVSENRVVTVTLMTEKKKKKNTKDASFIVGVEIVALRRAIYVFGSPA